MNLKSHTNDLLFLPLGGAGEIGMNANLYQYQGKWILVDLGAGFAEDFMPGIDMLVPNIDFIIERKKDLLGIIVTHCHEDHLGAIPYLWEELKCPIYTTNFTATFLKAKVAEFHSSALLPIHEVKPGDHLSLGPFDIHFIPLTHSTLEMQALAIKTDVGTIMHTGDWKFDDTPVEGEASDLKTLKEYGDEGILALVCDSTNAFQEGHSGSEGDVERNLINLIQPCKQLVCVTTFASNVARFHTIAKAAEKTGRRLLIAGRSLWRIYRTARECGYLADIQEPLQESQFKNHDRNKLLLLCTGCQGEPFAAMNKLVNDSHHSMRLKQGDAIIFSSKIIPGNDKRIFRMFNKCVEKKIEIFTEKDHFVHVSGHPSKEELKQMYELVRPEVAIPVHGERMHMHQHAKDSLTWGAKQAIEVVDGTIVKLKHGGSKVIGEVDAGYFGIDGYCLQDPDGQVLRARRKMMKAGCIFVTLICNPNLELLSKPLIQAPGSLDDDYDKDILSAISDQIADQLGYAGKAGKGRAKGGKPMPKRVSVEAYDNRVRSMIRTIYKQDVGTEPLIKVHIEILD